MIAQSDDLKSALAKVARDKAGVLPPFLSQAELDAGLSAWDRLYANPRIAWCQDPPRYLMGPEMYLEPAFAQIATHPVVLEAARSVLGVPDISLSSYHIVGTPPYAKEPSDVRDLNASFHVDHVIYSDIPVPDSPDNVFVCLWVNFHELKLENGPLCLAVGTDRFNIGWEFFKDGKRPELNVQDMHWARLLELNVGPAGTTGVYSGKTWHTATNNASQVTRKGLQLMFSPSKPKTLIRRPWFDIAGMPDELHSQLKQLIAGKVPIPDATPAQQKIFREFTAKEIAHEKARKEAHFIRPCLK